MQRSQLHRLQQTSEQEDGQNHKWRSKGHSTNTMHYFTTKYFSTACKSPKWWHKSLAYAKKPPLSVFSVEKALPGEEMKSWAVWLLHTILKDSLHLAASSKTTIIFFLVTKKYVIYLYSHYYIKPKFSQSQHLLRKCYSSWEAENFHCIIKIRDSQEFYLQSTC